VASVSQSDNHVHAPAGDRSEGDSNGFGQHAAATPAIILV
jgi:hypothetical protein